MKNMENRRKKLGSQMAFLAKVITDISKKSTCYGQKWREKSYLQYSCYFCTFLRKRPVILEYIFIGAFFDLLNLYF
jgi:hypothetical protein